MPVGVAGPIAEVDQVDDLQPPAQQREMVVVDSRVCPVRELRPESQVPRDAVDFANDGPGAAGGVPLLRDREVPVADHVQQHPAPGHVRRQVLGEVARPQEHPVQPGAVVLAVEEHEHYGHGRRRRLQNTRDLQQHGNSRSAVVRAGNRHVPARRIGLPVGGWARVPVRAEQHRVPGQGRGGGSRRRPAGDDIAHLQHCVPGRMGEVLPLHAVRQRRQVLQQVVPARTVTRGVRNSRAEGYLRFQVGEGKRAVEGRPRQGLRRK